MMRLVILAGPIASSLSGVSIAAILAWIISPLYVLLEWVPNDYALPWATKTPPTQPGKLSRQAGMVTRVRWVLNASNWQFLQVYNTPLATLVRVAVGALIALALIPEAREFIQVSQQIAHGLSNPQIMMKGRLQDGSTVMVDDYRQAYWFLRDQTPEDSRVMAWWDYGYQITGIGNRTTIADGNTWNHEHIATLGRCLTLPVKDAHRIIRHLADYVLVWSGGGGDDMAKSPHLARIANSVFHDVCPGDPTCQHFGMDRDGNPTPMMSKSLLYNLVLNKQRPGVSVDSNRFQEVFTSKYHKVRIYKVMSVSKTSKDWLADPANRVCDAPGSWYCPGQYPPALSELIDKREAFSQLEDFNTNKDAAARQKAEEYQRQYMSRMNGQGPPGPQQKAHMKS